MRPERPCSFASRSGFVIRFALGSQACTRSPTAGSIPRAAEPEPGRAPPPGAIAERKHTSFIQRPNRGRDINTNKNGRPE